VLGGTGQVGNGSTDMSLADAQKIADRAIQVRSGLSQTPAPCVSMQGPLTTNMQSATAFGAAVTDGVLLAKDMCLQTRCLEAATLCQSTYRLQPSLAHLSTPSLQVVPSLKAAEVLDHWVGLRPGRVRLRLELEEFDHAALTAAAEAAGSEGNPLQQGRGRLSDALKVVHCYGHGGSGLTLAWGTAGDAVQMCLKALQV